MEHVQIDLAPVIARPQLSGAVLLFSNDTSRLATLRQWVAEMAPGVTLLETRRVEDAAIVGGRERIALAVLDHAGASPLSPLVRLLRRHTPDVTVMVFSTDKNEAIPPLIPWSKLLDRLKMVVQR